MGLCHQRGTRFPHKFLKTDSLGGCFFAIGRSSVIHGLKCSCMYVFSLVSVVLGAWVCLGLSRLFGARSFVVLEAGCRACALRACINGSHYPGRIQQH